MATELLGEDRFGKLSSLATVKSGPNRGKRLPENGGEWICTGGYTHDSRWDEKNAHASWLRSMQKLGFRTGRFDMDGVVNLYVFKEFDNSVK